MNSRRIGIIDIGSNSIRLVIYDIQANGAYRVISEFKQSARLSGRMSMDGSLPAAGIDGIVRILQNFRGICKAHQVTSLRAVATAAIRNASNSEEIVNQLREQSGIQVELLTGEDEARIGFLGMSQTLDIADGLLIDIGGGSTEVSLFRGKKLLHSVSFPFGAVNTARRFNTDGEAPEAKLHEIRNMVLQAVASEPWIRTNEGKPMVGLGGTFRSLCKIHQRRHQYPLPITHNYPMSGEAMQELTEWLPKLPPDKRKKVDGLSKDRFDLIVPGLIIVDTLFQASGSSHCVISGAGLRDGIFYESFAAEDTSLPIAERSSDNLYKLHSTVPPAHSKHVKHSALTIYDALTAAGKHPFDPRTRLCLEIAAKLYRIGVSLSYYQYAKHTFYMLAGARIDGLTHRETLLCAFIATYKTKKRLLHMWSPYREIMLDSDVELVVRLGSILQLAVALDSSETQPLHLIYAVSDDKSLRLQLQIQNDPTAEFSEVEELQKDFRKIWGLSVQLNAPSFSTI
ncbi:Ppx/GppA phosphatase family protein [Paenibacillus silviterrae]|uniref:Ppx/GppA phosphatase family protein n=1 Tax=Paenibacillus silviterrae TaxID=3242194 RepID=UPI0025439108|nr:Ppx/GppA phosphatase family protein [Paenibacillus chinjuensis]